MSIERINEDALNLMCGDLIGAGTYRDVFECRIAPQYVVKVERSRVNGWRKFANVTEMMFWDEQQNYKKVADWLAPCFLLSPDGRILLQHRVDRMAVAGELPEMIPGFLSDLKPQNFGWLGGRFVCVDYSFTLPNPRTALRKVKWRTGETVF